MGRGTSGMTAWDAPFVPKHLFGHFRKVNRPRSEPPVAGGFVLVFWYGPAEAKSHQDGPPGKADHP